MTASNYSNYSKRDFLINVQSVEFLSKQHSKSAQRKNDENKTTTYSQQNPNFASQSNENSLLLNLFNHQTNQTPLLTLETPTEDCETNLTENYYSTLMSSLITDNPLSMNTSGEMESDSVSLEDFGNDFKPAEKSQMENSKMANSFENDFLSNWTKTSNDISLEYNINTDNWLNNLNDNTFSDSCHSPDYISCNHICTEDYNLWLQSEQLPDHTYAELNSDEYPQQQQSPTEVLPPIIENDPVFTKAHFNLTGKITFKELQCPRSKSPIINTVDCIPINELHNNSNNNNNNNNSNINSRKRNSSHFNDDHELIINQKNLKLQLGEKFINYNDDITTPDVVDDIISLYVERDEQLKTNPQYCNLTPIHNTNYIDSNVNIVDSPISFKNEYTDNDDNDNNIKLTFDCIINNSNDGSTIAPSTPASLLSPCQSIKYENPPSVASSFVSVDESINCTISSRRSTNPPTPDSSIDGTVKKRRGRPPKTQSTPPDPKLLEKLDKGDREYAVQRWKNNEASRKSRLRSKNNQEYLEEQLLVEENRNRELKETLESLQKVHSKLLKALQKKIQNKQFKEDH